MKIDIEEPKFGHCTGCPMSNMFVLDDEYHYACNYLHTELRAGGEYRNYAIQDKRCPFKVNLKGE